jgi:glycosyltransferase involved in cell wall biosynthesis
MESRGSNLAPRTNVLIVSSFVLPHAGGVEQFVDTAKKSLRARGCLVRVLACRPRSSPAEADATLPSWFIPPGGWPLPVGGWRTLWREIGATDVVIANGARNLLPALAAILARLRRTPVIFVLHGSGAPFVTSSFLYHRLLGSSFEWLVARPALHLSHVVALSRAGVAGARSRYGVEATYVPYPLRELPPRKRRVAPVVNRPLGIVWVGRLYPEKNPLGAVAVVERVREIREATLEIYGDGVLAHQLELLARDRPWAVVRGSRTWAQIQQVQDRADVCLSTSLRDATQIGILEPLSRGIPVVSTRVGDAPRHYVVPQLRKFCVEPVDVDAAAAAILELADVYDRYRDEFAANGRLLEARHRQGGATFAALVAATAAPAAARTGRAAMAGS